MPKLSEYVATAAADYLQETGKTELDARWVAEFFQDSGLLDEYPRQNLITFFALVQKALLVQAERSSAEARRLLEKTSDFKRTRRRA